MTNRPNQSDTPPAAPPATPCYASWCSTCHPRRRRQPGVCSCGAVSTRRRCSTRYGSRVGWCSTKRTGAVAEATAARHAAGVRQSVSTPTNDTAEAVNELVRDRLIAAGLVDNQTTAHGMDGLRMGRGDLVMTRRNDRDLDVANRIVWQVRRVTAQGSVELRGARDRRQRRVVPARYVRESMQLAYASTAHAVQGETSTVGEFLCTDAANAAAVYVGLTRGREQNTFHCVAGSVDEARDQFVDAMHRDRSDIGLVQATRDASGEAARYGRGCLLYFADRMAAALNPDTHTRRAEEQTVAIDHAPPAATQHTGPRRPP